MEKGESAGEPVGRKDRLKGFAQHMVGVLV